MHSPRTKKVSLMCLFAAISSSLGVLVACGPSSKVIAIYGPSTLTSENVIFSALGEFGAAEVAVTCAAAAAYAQRTRTGAYRKRRIISGAISEPPQHS